MRSVPTSNGVLLLSVQFAEGGKLANHCLAETWGLAGCGLRPFRAATASGERWLIV